MITSTGSTFRVSAHAILSDPAMYSDALPPNLTSAAFAISQALVITFFIVISPLFDLLLITIQIYSYKVKGYCKSFYAAPKSNVLCRYIIIDRRTGLWSISITLL